MKERPILFSGQMVRAILNGTKTQTRRVIKPQPAYVCGHDNEEVWHPDEKHLIKCPYGVPGDRLWVRETWRPLGVSTHSNTRKIISADNIEYRADEAKKIPNDINYATGNWKPSIHMPRWASRILLEIKDIRAERVQKISEEDAKAEGATRPPNFSLNLAYRQWFEYLWDSINAKRGYGWNANPWVWVVDFFVLEVKS